MIEKITIPKKLVVPKALKKLVLDAIKRHAWNIGVSHFVGDVLWMAEDKKIDGHYVVAEDSVDRRYLRCTFKLYPEFIKHWRNDGDPYVESTIAHEVAHIATQHLFDVAIARYCDDGEMKDAWETLTEVIGKLSTRLDRAKRKVKP